jgi:hypothetical protein
LPTLTTVAAYHHCHTRQDARGNLMLGGVGGCLPPI